MILSAQSIRNWCKVPKHLLPLISPFHDRTEAFGLTFGLSPAGYDVRIDQDMVLGTVEMGTSFQLGSTVEQFHMPNSLIAFVKDKSTWARRGLVVQNTVIEPGWSGYLTLELTNHGNRPIQLQKGMPIAQIVFQKLDEETKQPYEGRYQNQESGPQEARILKKK